MPTSICVDINIIVDVLLKRSGHEASSEVLAAGAEGQYDLIVSAHEVTTLAYLLEKAHIPRQRCKAEIVRLLELFLVVPTTEKLLKQALLSDIDDFEDAVVEQAALGAGCGRIVTRNTKDFAGSKVRAVTPETFLKHA